MHRNDLLRRFVGDGGVVLDHTGRGWPGDLTVVTDPADQSAEVVVHVVEAGATAEGGVDLDAIRATLAGTREPTVVLLGVTAENLPVAAIVEVTVSAGQQVVAVVGLDDPDTPTAIVVRHVVAATPALHPYLRWDDEPVPIADDAVLRLANEHAVEGFVWRSVETGARAAQRRAAEAASAASKARDELAAVLGERDDAVAAAAHELEAARQEALALEARRAALEGRVKRITTSRSYRFARRLAGAKRRAARIVGAGRH